jgi:hypothetical protein
VERTGPGKTETFIGWTILVVLTIIAAGVLVKQSHYDEALFNPPAPTREDSLTGQTGSPAAPSELQAYLPDALKPLTPMESFGPDNLSDKIDGKAELYLAAGFLKLRCQRFALTNQADAWLEVFVYDMGSLRNAFAVYGSQRRADAEKAALTRFAYRTSNALFFVHGQDYVEIVAAAPSAELVREVLAYGQNLVSQKPARSEEVSELALFPAEDLDEAGISLLATDVFGFEGLNNVFIANYTLAATPLTAFLSLRATPEEARQLASAYEEFLRSNGGTPVPLHDNLPDAVLIELFGTFELVFAHGRMLAGVHEAPDREAAEKLGLRILQGLTEVAP